MKIFGYFLSQLLVRLNSGCLSTYDNTKSANGKDEGVCRFSLAGSSRRSKGYEGTYESKVGCDATGKAWSASGQVEAAVKGLVEAQVVLAPGWAIVKDLWQNNFDH